MCSKCFKESGGTLAQSQPTNANAGQASANKGEATQANDAQSVSTQEEQKEPPKPVQVSEIQVDLCRRTRPDAGIARRRLV